MTQELKKRQSIERAIPDAKSQTRKENSSRFSLFLNSGTFENLPAKSMLAIDTQSVSNIAGGSRLRVERDENIFRNSFSSSIGDIGRDPNSLRVDTGEDGTSRAIEELLKRKDMLEKMTAADSATPLMQVLNNISKSKHRQGILSSGDLGLESEKNSASCATQGSSKRRITSKVFRYTVESQDSEKEQTSKKAVMESVGTDVK